ncbi:tRNA threonylcarbamoyladenosine dehydratase [Myxococcota bacterium]|nr:tRNA threonylcarbamoyladenosine dehydratase [Myxococcota bacterium]
MDEIPSLEELARESMSRLRMRLGDEGLARIRRARVAVVGLGAVGGFAMEALARSAVGTLRLVDFDVLRGSNLNRQLLATVDTLGRRKVDAARERIARIAPWVEVEAMDCFFDDTVADRVLALPLDGVVDAIDALGPKIRLLEECRRRGIPVVSAMGAADRTDPSMVRVGDLSDSRNCPLAKRVRKGLRRRGIEGGIRAVWSEEPPFRPPEPLAPDVPEEHDAFRRGRRRRTLPSMAPLPGIFGLAAAAEMLRLLLGGDGDPGISRDP